MKGGRGVITPLVILGGWGVGVINRWVNLSVTGNGGPLPKVIPEGRRPPTPGDLSVTGNGDLPLATFAVAWTASISLL